MSGISSNPADDLALAKIEKKRKLSFLERRFFHFNGKVKENVKSELLR